MSFLNFLSFINNKPSTELIKINQFLNQEVAILKKMVKEGRKNPNNKERRILGILANDIKKVLRKGLVETMFQPETILKWYRQFANQKFDGSKNREYQGKGRPKTEESTIKIIIQMANENRTWGADRIVGQLAALGITVSDQTVLNILKENDIPIAPDRKKEKTWNEFIQNHFEQNEAMMAKFSCLAQPIQLKNTMGKCKDARSKTKPGWRSLAVSHSPFN